MSPASSPLTPPVTAIAPADSHSDRPRVWLRRTGVLAKVRVDATGVEWLRMQLQGRGFACEEPMLVPGTPCSTFRVALGVSTSLERLHGVVEQLPSVELMLDPA